MSKLLRVLCVLTPLVILASWWNAINPRDWMLENILVLAGLLGLGFSYRRVPLSDTSYLFLFLFLGIHEFGAVYTYSNVPLRGPLVLLSGERNHYDRMVHFLFGLLLTVPIVDAWAATSTLRRWQTWLIAFLVVGCVSALYEIAEFAITQIVDPELGDEFLGAQGDDWDAQKDQALAMAGSLLTIAALAVTGYRYRRN